MSKSNKSTVRKQWCLIEAYETIGWRIARSGAGVKKVERMIVIRHVFLVRSVSMAEEDDICALLLCQALKRSGAVFDVVVIAVGEEDLMPLEGNAFKPFDEIAAEDRNVIVITAYYDPRDIWKEVGKGVHIGKSVTEKKDDLGISVHIKRSSHKKR